MKRFVLFGAVVTFGLIGSLAHAAPPIHHGGHHVHVPHHASVSRGFGIYGPSFSFGYGTYGSTGQRAYVNPHHGYVRPHGNYAPPLPSHHHHAW